MKVIFTPGAILHVIEDNNIIAVKCVADDPKENNPFTICNYCIFHGNLDCWFINCDDCHFEAIERKEVKK